MVVWMHEEPLVVGRTYIAKHTTRTVRATVRAIRYRVDVGSLDEVAAERLAMNEIAEVEFETNLPLFFDAYAENRSMGALILIDGLTNATVGAAMILGAAEATDEDAERTLFVLVPGRTALAERVRDALGAQGERAVVIDDALISDGALVGVIRALQLAGVVAISARVLDESVLAQLETYANKGLVLGDGLDEDEILRLAGVTE
jgi:bifunctional enzyme CysN/CysC/sulfate adenylyltransferase subunit 1